MMDGAIEILWRPVGSGGGEGLEGFSSYNNLQKFVDFVSEQGCESQGRGIEDWNSYIFSIYQNKHSLKHIIKNYHRPEKVGAVSQGFRNSKVMRCVLNE